MSRIDLERIKKWAMAKIAGGQERKISVRQYAQLRQAVDGILEELDAATQQDSLKRPGGQSANHLQLVWSNQSPSQTVD
jgi:hypothetical protein